MNNKCTTLLFVGLLLISIVSGYTQYYTREFQFQLDLDRFDDGRDSGIDYYYTAWADAAGLDDYTELEDFAESIREEYLIEAENCGTSDMISQRNYVWGDWEGMTITQIKTSGALTESEALDEPFDPAEGFDEDTISYIEYDIHPCEADWSATSRVFLSELPEIETCADIDDFFPDAVSRSNDDVSSSSDGYTFTAFRNGTYLGAQVTLDVTLYYSSLNDAINDNDLQGGEFSFTMYSETDEFTDEQTEWGIRIYEDMLEEVGSEPDYPCDPPQDIADFFDDTGNNNDSTANTLSCSVILILALMLIC